MQFFKILILSSAFIFLSILIGDLVFERLYPYQKIDYGVTFSPGYARYLNLDWQKTFLGILDDLQVKNLRIPGYWDMLEPEPDQYDFTQTDFMLNEAGKRNTGVILVLGVKQPRWPECHVPAWAKKLSVGQRQQKILDFTEKVVKRYKDYPVVRTWQVENEPLLGSFGEGCDTPDINFLKKEVELVRNLSSKKIIMTDSGELGFWVTPMSLSDIFGTTLYRKVYSYFAQATYPIPPYLYNVKSSLARIFAPDNKRTIVVEFQAEPWLPDGNFVSAKSQSELFTPDDFRNYINYAKKTGFDEIYLWGVEWWYFMNQNGHPEYLNFAKTLFNH